MEEKLPRRIAWFAPWTWKRRTKIVASLLLVLVAYPLSIGPMAWVQGKGVLPDTVVDFLIVTYTPLEYVASQSLLTAMLLMAYIDFWQSLP
jgi:hypothetical protein